MSAEGHGTNENYLAEIKRLVTEEYSLLRAALAKLEEKVGPVTADNIFEKSSGILTHKEADDLYVTVLADRDQGLDSAQIIIEKFEGHPGGWNSEEMQIRRTALEDASSLLRKLNSQPEGDKAEKSIDDSWSPMPRIEGLSREETGQIYNGNYQGVLQKIAAMPEKERSTFLNDLEGSIGNAFHALDEDAAEMYSAPEQVGKSIDNLRSFHDAVRALHPGS